MTTSSRIVPGRATKVAQAVRNRTLGATSIARARTRSRDSCFHRAARFSATVTTAEPWITWINRPGV